MSPRWQLMKAAVLDLPTEVSRLAAKPSHGLQEEECTVSRCDLGPENQDFKTTSTIKDNGRCREELDKDVDPRSAVERVQVGHHVWETWICCHPRVGFNLVLTWLASHARCVL